MPSYLFNFDVVGAIQQLFLGNKSAGAWDLCAHTCFSQKMSSSVKVHVNYGAFSSLVPPCLPVPLKPISPYMCCSYSYVGIALKAA